MRELGLIAVLCGLGLGILNLLVAGCTAAPADRSPSPGLQKPNSSRAQTENRDGNLAYNSSDTTGSVVPVLEQDQSTHVKLPDSSSALALQAELEVACEDPKTCSPSVAMLVAKNDAEISVCTAFLVAPNIIATNKHCLPSTLQVAGATCLDSVLFKFPKARGFAQISIACQGVISVSNSDGTVIDKRPDFTFLRLVQNVNRPSLVISQAGLGDGDTVTIPRLIPHVAESLGIISELRCSALQSTIATPGFTSPYSRIVHFANCPLVHGNSGSPAIAADGTVRAIISHGTESAQGSRFRNFARATNLSCVNLPAAGIYILDKPECIAQADEDTETALVKSLYADVLKRNSETVKIQIENAAKEWIETHHNGFQWKLAKLPKPVVATNSSLQEGSLLSRATLTPDCIQPDLLGRDDLGKQESSAGHVVANVDLPVWNVVATSDEDYRPNLGVKMVINPSQFYFDPKRLQETGETQIGISGLNSGYQVPSRLCAPAVAQHNVGNF